MSPQWNPTQTLSCLGLNPLLRTLNAVTDWQGPCWGKVPSCGGFASPVMCSLTPGCDFCVLWLFSESTDCFLTSTALSAFKTFHVVDYLHRNISWFSLCVCMSVITLHPSWSLLMELAPGLLCSGAFGTCQHWERRHYSLSTMNHLLIFFYAIFILALLLQLVRSVSIHAFLLFKDLVQLNHPSPGWWIYHGHTSTRCLVFLLLAAVPLCDCCVWHKVPEWCYQEFRRKCWA